MNELMVHQNDDIAPIADDFLISMADQAERRIDAVIKIKNVALKVTNARDWTDQNGNPYLQVSGSEKIANLFNMSWRIEEPKYEEEPDGHFTYSIKGIFSLGSRSIEVEGTRSSKDPFFNRYDYSQPKDPVTKKHPVLPPHTIDKGDVKKAALTNLYGNGITRMLGIRNLTWEDLEKYAGITRQMIEGKISYNQREAGQPPVPTIKTPTQTAGATAPQGEASKSSAGAEEKTGTFGDSTPPQHNAIYAILKKIGVTDDHEKYARVSAAIGAQTVISSLKELSKKEASAAIEALGKEEKEKNG
jgi:hypothetical protein